MRARGGARRTVSPVETAKGALGMDMLQKYHKAKGRGFFPSFFLSRYRKSVYGISIRVLHHWVQRRNIARRVCQGVIGALVCEHTGYVWL